MLFQCSSVPLTAEQRVIADRLFAEYCARPKHANRLNARLLGALRAGANSVARHGNPPNGHQRLAYRMHKKRRAKLAAVALYGNPSASHPTPSGEVPAPRFKPPSS